MIGGLIGSLAALLAIVVFRKIERTGTVAEAEVFTSFVPTQSANGNNPDSQYVHEVGGPRFCGLVGVLVGVAIALLVDWETRFSLIDAAEPLKHLLSFGASFGAAVLTVAVLLASNLVDPAEHGAEGMHGDQARLDPVAQQWLNRMGFVSYSDGEAWRMVQPGAEYEHLTEAEFKARLRRVRLISRIILKLAW